MSKSSMHHAWNKLVAMRIILTINRGRKIIKVRIKTETPMESLRISMGKVKETIKTSEPIELQKDEEKLEELVRVLAI